MPADERGASQFDSQRGRLRSMALRILGSANDAEDAVQETWLKLTHVDTSTLQSLPAWLTTTLARVCIDMLRARRSSEAAALAATDPDMEAGMTLEHETELADSVGSALSIVLGALSPEERVAFVLHDIFDMPFEAVGRILERRPEAARKLASRARRRLRGAKETMDEAAAGPLLVEAFLAASRKGDVTQLIALLAPDVVLRADSLAVRAAKARAAQGAPELAPEIRGARAVAKSFAGRAGSAVAARIDGAAGAVWRLEGVVRSAFLFGVSGGRIVSIELVMEPEHLRTLTIVVQDGHLSS